MQPWTTCHAVWNRNPVSRDEELALRRDLSTEGQQALIGAADSREGSTRSYGWSNRRAPTSIVFKLLVRLKEGASVSIAVLEREPSRDESLQALLESAGHRVSKYTSWATLFVAAGQTRFDAIVLDCGGGVASDTEALTHVRNLVGPAAPILVCSQRCGEMDVVAALRAGADDYLPKPVRGGELMARLEAVTRRRVRAAFQLDCRQVGEFLIDRRQRTIHRNGVAIPLTAIDFDLAVLFLTNVQQLLTRDHIHEVIWKRANVLRSRTLDTHVSRVRNRLNLLPVHGWRLVSVYGYGYRLMRLAAPVVAGPQMPLERMTAAPVIAL